LSSPFIIGKHSSEALIQERKKKAGLLFLSFLTLSTTHLPAHSHKHTHQHAVKEGTRRNTARKQSKRETRKEKGKKMREISEEECIGSSCTAQSHQKQVALQAPSSGQGCLSLL
jgi:hypothetical protein